MMHWCLCPAKKKGDRRSNVLGMQNQYRVQVQRLGNSTIGTNVVLSEHASNTPLRSQSRDSTFCLVACHRLRFGNLTGRCAQAFFLKAKDSESTLSLFSIPQLAIHSLTISPSPIESFPIMSLDVSKLCRLPSCRNAVIIQLETALLIF